MPRGSSTAFVLVALLLLPPFALAAPGDPAITHVEVTRATAGEDLFLEAWIEAATGETIAAATLHYRAIGEAAFTPIAMTVADADMYGADLPGDAITDEGAEYYIEAIDSVGATARYPELGPGAPIVVTTPPGAPTDLEAPRTDAGVSLTWTAPPTSADDTVASYRVLRSTGGAFALVGTSTTTSYDDATAALGTAFTYKVTAVDDHGTESDGSDEVDTTLGRIPEAPTLTLEAGDGSIAATWTAVEHATVYVLETSPDEETWTEVGAETNAATITIGGLTNGELLHVRLTPENAYFEPGEAAAGSARPITTPAAPTLSASAAVRRAELSWADASTLAAPISLYWVERGLDAAGPFEVIGATTDTDFVDEGLEAGTTYHYRVRGENAIGNGTYSAVDSARPTSSSSSGGSSSRSTPAPTPAPPPPAPAEPAPIPAKLRLENMLIPGSVEMGAPTAATADVVNDGNETGSADVLLLFEDRIVAVEHVTVGGGERVPVSLSFIAPAEGAFDITMRLAQEALAPQRVAVDGVVPRLGRLNATLTAIVGEPLPMRIDVLNVGNRTGSIPVEILLNGTLDQTHTVVVDAHGRKTLSFDLRPASAGVQPLVIRAAGAAPVQAIVVVLQTAPPSGPMLVIADVKATQPVEVGEIITIDVELRNVGAVEGPGMLTLHLFGNQRDSRSVTIGGGQTSHASFFLRAPLAGELPFELALKDARGVTIQKRGFAVNATAPQQAIVIEQIDVPPVGFAGEPATVAIVLKSWSAETTTVRVELLVGERVVNATNVTLAPRAGHPVSLSFVPTGRLASVSARVEGASAFAPKSMIVKEQPHLIRDLTVPEFLLVNESVIAARVVLVNERAHSDTIHYQWIVNGTARAPESVLVRGGNAVSQTLALRPTELGEVVVAARLVNGTVLDEKRVPVVAEPLTTGTPAVTSGDFALPGPGAAFAVAAIALALLVARRRR